MELVIVGIGYHKWSNTNWNEQIIPIEIARSQAPNYEGRHEVTVYGKPLGLLAIDRGTLPIGTRVFVRLFNCQKHVKAVLTDEPEDWKIPFSGELPYRFSNDFLYNCMHDDVLREWSSPVRFHEWLIRKGISVCSVDGSVIEDYVSFVCWLANVRGIDESSYSDREIEAYVKYCSADLI